MTMQLAPRNHQSAETMNELRALNARFIHNFVTNDVPSHDAILHPGFINIWPTGQRWDRATYLKYWATAFDPQLTSVAPEHQPADDTIISVYIEGERQERLS